MRISDLSEQSKICNLKSEIDMGFTVAIAGRPNVGKSTFFNRMMEERKAIVHDVSGVTRDRQYGIADWNGKSFNIIDTGGFVPDSQDIFEREIRKQVEIAVEEANAIVFMVDVTTGITDLDEAMADVLRRSSKPVFLVVNKVDNPERMMEAAEFYSLGFEKIFFLSSISGSGTGELLDAIAELIPEATEEILETASLPRFAIIGQPNVGKSSLLNALIGQERTIVSEIAGTTRDTIHTHYKLFQKEFILIDTAGIRRKAKVHEDLEFYSVIRAIKAIDEADVCLLLLDAEKGISAQDLTIYSLAARKGKGIVLLVNKWDLVEKENNTSKAFEKEIRSRTAPFTDYEILFISAINKQRIHKVLDLIDTVNQNRKRKISTSELNNLMLEITKKNPPPALKGKHVKIKYVTQLPTQTPAFAFFCNLPQYVKDPYKRYLENRIREKFEFTGVPIRIFFRKK